MKLASQKSVGLVQALPQHFMPVVPQTVAQLPLPSHSWLGPQLCPLVTAWQAWLLAAVQSLQLRGTQLPPVHMAALGQSLLAQHSVQQAAQRLPPQSFWPPGQARVQLPELQVPLLSPAPGQVVPLGALDCMQTSVPVA